MNWRRFWTATAALMILQIVSCGPVKDCDDISQEFYKCLKDKDYDRVLTFLDYEAIDNTPVYKWKQGLERKDQDYGMILNVERRDFESETRDNVTRIAIKYKVKYATGTMFERLEFIERDSKYRITYYKFDEDSTMVN